MTAVDYRALAAQLAAEQGLPEQIEDIATLRRLAKILDAGRDDVAGSSHRRPRRFTARATRPRGTSRVAS